MYRVLQEKISEVAGYRVNSPKDCTLLSEAIMQKTGRSVSVTTLRRFFGILKNESDFSTYNLDTLAIYAGYSDYGEFTEGLSGGASRERPATASILREIIQLSSHTLGSISRKSLSRFGDTIPRESINRMLNHFLESDQMVMPLIAPGGYGKSLALAHWLRSLKEEGGKKVIPLFCTAQVFLHLMKVRSANTGLISFDPTDPGNLFRLFEQDKSAYGSPLLLVVDGLDEMEAEVGKILELSAGISDLAVQYRRGGMLKIVISVREVTWNKYVKQEFTGQKPEWLLASSGYSLESGSNNLPVLSASEVRKLLSTCKECGEGRVVYESINWELRQLIRVPLNFHFFRTMIRTVQGLAELSPDRLMQEYLNELIFKSRFCEEKADLVFELVRINMNKGQAARKNEIRRKYPIHLKREANYYVAYNELVADSILMEERSENRYGLYITYIHFGHRNILYYLTALNLASVHEKIDHQLLKRITESGRSLEWRSNVLACMIQMAYRQEELNGLRNLCELDEEVLSTLPVRQAVGDAFRRDNLIREALVREYASHPLGQVQFFEMFVDTNYLFNNFSFRIREYLDHKHTLEARLFGHGILFLTAFISMNGKACEEQFRIFNELEPDSEVHPWPIGRKVGNTLLYRLIVLDEAPVYLEPFIREYTKIAYMYPGYLDRGAIEFEIMILLALTLAGEFKSVVHVGENALSSYEFSEGVQSGLSWRHKHQNAFARSYLEYARYKLSGKLKPGVVHDWEELLNAHLSVFDDFQNLIMLQYFLFDYYLDSGNPEVAGKYLQAALDLSCYAQYDFYEAFLKVKGAGLDPSYFAFASDRIRQSGFNPRAYCFTR